MIFFKDIGYDNTCYQLKQDRLSSNRKFMEDNFFCKRQLNCFREFRNYVCKESIEKEMNYPGQVQVTVVRETRAVEYAR